MWSKRRGTGWTTHRTGRRRRRRRRRRDRGCTVQKAARLVPQGWRGLAPSQVELELELELELEAELELEVRRGSATAWLPA